MPETKHGADQECPPAWASARLGGVFSRVTDRNYQQNRNVLTISAEHGLINQSEYFNRRVASENPSGYTLLQKGDFAYNKSYSRGFPVGVIRRLERYQNGVVSPLYICLRLTAKHHDADFWKHCFIGGLLDEQIAFVAKEGVRNHGLLNVAVDDLFAVRLCVPSSGSEQRLIAAILDTLDRMTTAAHDSIAKLKQILWGVRSDLLTRGIDANGELRSANGDVRQFNQSRYGKIPKAWEVVRVEKVCADIVDCPHSTPSYVSDGVPCIRTADLSPGRLWHARASRVSEVTFVERTRRLVPTKGDIIYSREGERFGIASPVGGERVCLGQRVMLLRPGPNADPTYLMWAMNAPSFYQQAMVRVGATTSPHVNVSDIRRFELCLPPMAEQQEIGKALAAQEERLASEEEAAAKLSLLKAALADDLLTGRVRVAASPESAKT